jgi:cation diffusion facilitator CzcD-associated flavoprotein CzcO
VEAHQLSVTRRNVIVLGAGAVESELRAAGITDVTVLSDSDVASSVFDDGTDTWQLHTASGETITAAVVISADQPPYRPWIPELPGRNDFRGSSFHAAQWDPAFDPAGKRVAVIGTDSAAGHYMQQLTDRAASVTVFTHPPRRFVHVAPLWTMTRATGWLRRARAIRTGPRFDGQAVVGAAIEALTSTGIRTRDGREHRADAIIYGTGFAASDARVVGAGGLVIQQAWQNGMEPFLGVAVHGFPNYFFVTGPDGTARTRYVIECIGLMTATASSRIEVRRSSQQVFNERANLNPAEQIPVASAFDLSGIPAAGAEIYDGAATLTIADACRPVRVRLTGRVDPIDGQYHWQGTVFNSPSEPWPDGALRQSRDATLTVDGLSAPARIVEQTPWGTHSIAGVGTPPYALINA